MEVLVLIIVIIIIVSVMASLDAPRKEEQARIKRKKEDEQLSQYLASRKLKIEHLNTLVEDLHICFEEVVTGNLPILFRKMGQTLYRDDYGAIAGEEKWANEVEYFRTKVLLKNEDILALVGLIHSEIEEKEISIEEFSFFDEFIAFFNSDAFFFYVKNALDNFDDNAPLDDPTEHDDPNSMTGTNYEVHCAAILEATGWSVIRKGGSGDQGVDLVAALGDLRVAVQCKRHSQPVGNKAIQEVNAGRQFEQCDLAVVVSNANYTPAARQLASALGVLLFHHSDLHSFREFAQEHFSALVSGEASA